MKLATRVLYSLCDSVHAIDELHQKLYNVIGAKTIGIGENSIAHVYIEFRDNME